jgi:hypothetical protein
MKKIPVLLAIVLTLPGCALLSELTALTRCEFSFHSAQDPEISGIDVRSKHSFSDFSLLDGQLIVGNILNGTLPFAITANVEVRNPGTSTAAVNAVEWLAFIDDIQVASGTVDKRFEVAPGGGTTIIPIRIRTDLFDYLEGDNPRTMLNFALNLMDAGGQPTRLSMKIKPSVLIGSQQVYYPGYFTITKEFSSGTN